MRLKHGSSGDGDPGSLGHRVGGLALASALFLSACAGPPDVERDPEPSIQTPELRYRLHRHDIGYSARIPFTFENATGVTVRVDHCEGDVRPLLQVQRNGRWVDAWMPLLRPCASPPLEIPPGGRYSDTLDVVGAPPGSNVTPAFVFEDVEGVYRMYWFQARLDPADSPTASEAGDTWRVSNAFVLSFR